jgi:catechol 2,3-dioxygenase-like lactoylglutathione lyase family enzyme
MTVSRAHLILYVRDQAQSTAFYAAVLGARPVLDVPGMTEFDLATGCVLGLMPEPSATRLLGSSADPMRANDRAARTEVYLLVDDPLAYHARALDAGAREVSPVVARDWGHDAGYSIDADGNVLAFARQSARVMNTENGSST